MPHAIFRHLAGILLRQRGQNQKLVDDIETLLPPDSQERLFRILQDIESELSASKRKAQMYGHVAHMAWFPHPQPKGNHG
jgi:hypothetical protein